MSGIYQLNQATGSVILPISGNTFIGTTPNSELFSVDPAGTVTIYGTGGGGSIDTGSFATTGSNAFSGSQTISGSLIVTGSTVLNPNSIPNVISGSFTLNDSILFNGDLTIPSGSEFIIPNGVSFILNGALINDGNFVISGSYTNLAPTSPYMALSVIGNVSASAYYGDGSQLTGINTNIDTGSFAVTASNSFTGSQTISGSVEITGSLNTTNTSGLLSQGIIDIIDEDLSSLFPAYNIASGSVNGFSFNSGSGSPAIFVGTTTLTNINGVTGGVLNGAAISFSSGSSAWNVGGQKVAGGTQVQLYYNPDYGSGNESYTVHVGDGGGGENRLVIQKEDTLGEGVQLKLSDITEGFVLGHNFSNSSASLFKVRDSGSANTIFDIRNNSTVFTQVSESLDFADDTAAGIGGVPLGGLYRSGSDIKIRMT